MEYTNSQIRELIDEYVHVQKYRDILKSRFIDGETFDALALHYDMSPRQLKNIVYKSQEQLFKHL
jgi:capsular polysaccharide biosynthesis protein